MDRRVGWGTFSGLPRFDLGPKSALLPLYPKDNLASIGSKTQIHCEV